MKTFGLIVIGAALLTSTAVLADLPYGTFKGKKPNGAECTVLADPTYHSGSGVSGTSFESGLDVMIVEKGAWRNFELNHGRLLPSKDGSRARIGGDGALLSVRIAGSTCGALHQVSKSVEGQIRPNL